MGSIREMLESERPRERLWQEGADGLKTSELIAILLRVGMKGKSALALGDEMLARYGSLQDLCQASALELSKIKGVGMAKAVQLKAAFELGSRLAASRRVEKVIDNASAVYDLLGYEMGLLPVESLRIIALNSRSRIIAVEEISRGVLDGTIGTTRDVLRMALLHHAYGIILVHNHPSGDPAPSAEDLEFTMQVRDAAKLMNIQFIDHVILGSVIDNKESPFYSFKETGYL